MLLLVGFMGYSAYSLFKNGANQTNLTSNPVIDTAVRHADSIAAQKEEKNRAFYRAKKYLIDSITRASINEEVQKSRKNQYEPDSTLVDTSEN